MSTTIKISDGDIDINNVTGKATLVRDSAKCSQDVANVMMLDRSQPNVPFKRAYGNELASLQNPVFFSGLVGKPLVGQKIQEAIQSLMDFQDADPNITPSEHIDHINRLTVDQFGVTDFIFYVEVAVKSGDTIPPVSNIEAVRLNQQFPMSSGDVQSR